MVIVHAEELHARGFHRVGQFSVNLPISVWWHAEGRFQLLMIEAGVTTLLKGSKAYYLRAITEEGETWARDIPQLHAYLEAHFPEMHLSLSWYRDLSPALAQEHLERLRQARRQLPVPTTAVASLRHQVERNKASSSAYRALATLDAEDDLLSQHLRAEATRCDQEAATAEEALKAARDAAALSANLQQEYLRKGSAATLVFSIGSNPQSVDDDQAFGDAVDAVVKELSDAHRFQVMQKLNGGRLNIHVAEADEPTLVWIEHWLGGFLSPRKLDHAAEAIPALARRARGHLMVTPDEDVAVGGETHESKKLLGAHVVRSMLERLDRPEPATALREVQAKELPVTVGLVDRVDRSSAPFVVPLAAFREHCYISGSTGSGKSYLGRVLIEEVAKHESTNILILDPRNQAAGIMVSEDRPEALERFAPFGLASSDARGFRFDYVFPGSGIGRDLPANLATLGQGRFIVSFKALDDRNRCALFARVMDTVFEDHAKGESSNLRLLIVVDEAQRFTKKRVDDGARKEAAAAENAIDRTVREGRKYGIGCLILSQSIRDYSHDSASVRQNTNIKIFLRNSDREIAYAADFLEDGRQIVTLPPGVALWCGSAQPGPVRVCVRPPLSKVWEFGERELSAILSGKRVPRPVSPEATDLLGLIRAQLASSPAGLNMTALAAVAGVTSKRELQRLVGELEQAGAIRTEKRAQRGQPRVILLADETDESRTEPGQEASSR